MKITLAINSYFVGIFYKLSLIFFILSISICYSQVFKFNNYTIQETDSRNGKYKITEFEKERQTYFVLNTFEESITLNYEVYVDLDKSFVKIMPLYKIIDQNILANKTIYICIDKLNADLKIIQIPLSEKYIQISEDCQDDNGYWCKKKTTIYDKGAINFE